MADALRHAREPDRSFTCCECGRDIVVLCGPAPGDAGVLCLSCVVLPGWFRDPHLRQAIDRDHQSADMLP